MSSRTSESEVLLWAFLLLFVLPAMMGAAVATASTALTLGFLGGVYRAWYAAYNGSVYYALQPRAAAALGAIAAKLQTGAKNVARNELDRWLDVYDPLGIVRQTIEAGGIETESPLFEEIER